MEYLGSVITGIYRDQLVDATGQVSYDSGWNNNTIMDSFHVLLARLIKHEDALFKTGKRALVMRFGEFDGSLPNPTTVSSSNEKLVNVYKNDKDDKVFELVEEPGDKNQLSVAYLNTNDSEQTNPVNRLQITAILGPYQPKNAVCNLGEFATYIRFTNGNGTSDDYIINHVRHPKISKAPTDTLIRQIRFTF